MGGTFRKRETHDAPTESKAHPAHGLAFPWPFSWHNRRPKWPGIPIHSLFARIVLMFLLILLPLLLAGILIHEWGLRLVREELAEAIRTQTQHNADMLESELEQIQMLQDELLMDDDLLFLSSIPDAFGEFEKVRAINRLKTRADTFNGSSLYVEDVELFITSIQRDVSAEHGVGVLEPEHLALMDRFPDKVSSLLGLEDGRLYTLVKSKLTAKGVLPPFTVRVTLSSDQLRKAAGTLNLHPGSNAYLYCPANGFLETSGMPDAGNPDAIWHAVSPHIQAAGEQVDNLSLVVKAEGIRYQVSAQRFRFRESFWMISTAPERQVLKSLQSYILLLWGFVLASLVLIVVFAVSTRRFVHKPMAMLVDAFRHVESGDLETTIPHEATDEFGYLYRQFNNMVAYIHRLINQVYAQKILNQKAELKQLQSQINPHFLYNSFFILQRMIQGEDTENAKAFSGYLGRYFQYVTRNGQDEVPLEKELAHTRNYLEIQAIRFAGTEMEITPIPEKWKNFSVPRLILQPLVENTFTHAFRHTSGHKHIRILFETDGPILHIHVENSGPGPDPAALADMRHRLDTTEASEVETTGLVNIHRRLRLMYGNEGGLSVDTGALGGWRVTLTLPPQDHPQKNGSPAQTREREEPHASPADH